MTRKNSKDYNPATDNIKVFIAGDYGTGKSCFAATFPTPGYVINSDNKVGAYEGADWTYIDIAPGPAGWVILSKELILIEKEVKEKKYKTVVMDSVTSLMDIALQRAMQLDPKRSPTDGPLWNVHYQMQKNLVEGVIKRLLRFEDCNVLILAHLRPETDEDGNIIKYEPLITGQLSVTIPGLFDEVLISDTQVKNGKTSYIIRTVPHAKKKARSSLKGKAGRIPDVIPNEYSAYVGGLK